MRKTGNGEAEHGDKRGGSMKRALEIAQSPTGREEGIKALKQSFWAPSTLQVRKTRREEVMELAQMVCEKGNPVFPLTEGTIVAVAGALKAAGRAQAVAHRDGLRSATMDDEMHWPMQEGTTQRQRTRETCS